MRISYFGLWSQLCEIEQTPIGAKLFSHWQKIRESLGAYLANILLYSCQHIQWEKQEKVRCPDFFLRASAKMSSETHPCDFPKKPWLQRWKKQSRYSWSGFQGDSLLPRPTSLTPRTIRVGAVEIRSNKLLTHLQGHTDESRPKQTERGICLHDVISEPGHISRYCLTPAPKSSAPQPQLNKTMEA